MTESITHMMAKEHERLKRLLHLAFSGGAFVDQRHQRIFNQFKANLEKHVFLDEKAILETVGVENEENAEEMAELLEENNRIIKIADQIERDLQDGITPDISILEEELDLEEEIEKEVLYDRLEEDLDPKQKSEFKKELKQILPG